MDENTLHNSFVVMEQAIQAKSTKPSAPSVIVQSRVVRLMAAAAVIIVAVCLFLDRGRNTPSEPTTRPRPVAQSTVKKMSLMSLRMTYQRGGFDALDRQFRDTLNALGPQPLSISLQELLEGVNGF